jgi:hypothetical protein
MKTVRRVLEILTVAIMAVLFGPGFRLRDRHR